jgi:hypothetical protein
MLASHIVRRFKRVLQTDTLEGIDYIDMKSYSLSDKELILNLGYIDLKQVNSNDLFLNLGYTKAQWGNSKNIYLLSERGYMKGVVLNDTLGRLISCPSFLCKSCIYLLVISEVVVWYIIRIVKSI